MSALKFVRNALILVLLAVIVMLTAAVAIAIFIPGIVIGAAYAVLEVTFALGRKSVLDGVKDWTRQL
jgi:type III secretory pathway component EscU